jgi:hypothetical protein
MASSVRATGHSLPPRDACLAIGTTSLTAEIIRYQHTMMQENGCRLKPDLLKINEQVSN